jgi:hypothetical protein
LDATHIADRTTWSLLFGMTWIVKHLWKIIKSTSLVLDSSGSFWFLSYCVGTLNPMHRFLLRELGSTPVRDKLNDATREWLLPVLWMYLVIYSAGYGTERARPYFFWF